MRLPYETPSPYCICQEVNEVLVRTYAIHSRLLFSPFPRHATWMENISKQPAPPTCRMHGKKHDLDRHSRQPNPLNVEGRRHILMITLGISRLVRPLADSHFENALQPPATTLTP